MDFELLIERAKERRARMKAQAKRRARKAEKRKQARTKIAATAVDKAAEKPTAPPPEKKKAPKKDAPKETKPKKDAPKKDPGAAFQKSREAEWKKRAREKAAWDKGEKEVETDRLKKLLQKNSPEIDVPKDWKCPGGYEKDTKKSATSPRKVCTKVGRIKKFLHKIGVRKIRDDVEPSLPTLIESLHRSLD